MLVNKQKPKKKKKKKKKKIETTATKQKKRETVIKLPHLRDLCFETRTTRVQ
jgi:hypothetical protein